MGLCRKISVFLHRTLNVKIGIHLGDFNARRMCVRTEVLVLEVVVVQFVDSRETHCQGYVLLMIWVRVFRELQLENVCVSFWSFLKVSKMWEKIVAARDSCLFFHKEKSQIQSLMGLLFYMTWIQNEFRHMYGLEIEGLLLHNFIKLDLRFWDDIWIFCPKRLSCNCAFFTSKCVRILKLKSVGSTAVNFNLPLTYEHKCRWLYFRFQRNGFVCIVHVKHDFIASANFCDGVPRTSN